MSVKITPEDWQQVQDWAVVFALFVLAFLAFALALGLAVRLFFWSGGI